MERHQSKIINKNRKILHSNSIKNTRIIDESDNNSLKDMFIFND